MHIHKYKHAHTNTINYIKKGEVSYNKSSEININATIWSSKLVDFCLISFWIKRIAVHLIGGNLICGQINQYVVDIVEISHI